MSDIDDNDEELLDLNIKIDDVDTTAPALNPGKYDAEIADASVVRGKRDPSKKFLNIRFRLLEDATSTRGKPINPGFTFFYRLSLQDQGGSFDFREPLAKLFEAATGEKSAVSRETIADLKERKVVVQVVASKNTEYSETEVKGVYPYVEKPTAE